LYKRVNIQKKKAPGTLVAGGFLWGESFNKKFSMEGNGRKKISGFRITAQKNTQQQM